MVCTCDGLLELAQVGDLLLELGGIFADGLLFLDVVLALVLPSDNLERGGG